MIVWCKSSSMANHVSAAETLSEVTKRVEHHGKSTPAGFLFSEEKLEGFKRELPIQIQAKHGKALKSKILSKFVELKGILTRGYHAIYYKNKFILGKLEQKSKSFWLAMDTRKQPDAMYMHSTTKYLSAKSTSPGRTRCQVHCIGHAAFLHAKQMLKEVSSRNIHSDGRADTECHRSYFSQKQSKNEAASKRSVYRSGCTFRATSPTSILTGWGSHPIKSLPFRIRRYYFVKCVWCVWYKHSEFFIWFSCYVVDFVATFATNTFRDLAF